ncbi:hypothetical protein BX600DRAFT_428733 [Xylariales sp. PMI_506]|nr:hypothetical protein BX600DRAFT_428733 [Xylariales sp. PMI_506]
MASRELHVGICGAGIGGLCAAIAIRKAGARVTVLEAAQELGEIGAGIQMTPNAARLLQRWGVDKIIGENLVRFNGFNLRRRDGEIVGHTDALGLEEDLGHPWWVVHRAEGYMRARAHLHEGLSTAAKENGAEIHIRSRVTAIEHENQPQNKVTVKTELGATYTFNLLIGADGLNSTVRRILFSKAPQRAPTNNCAYRAVVPYERIRTEKPHVWDLFAARNMETWTGPNGYIIGYPISAGREFNMVLSHHRQDPVTCVEEVPASETQALLAQEYADYDAAIREVVSLIEPGSIARWPLIATGPLDQWSSPSRNVTLMGDAAHSMVNHMAQGAATSMEDGAFLGALLAEVVKGGGNGNNDSGRRRKMTLGDALEIYEAARMPQARMKQQVSFLNGAIWMLGDADAEARDAVMRSEAQGLGDDEEVRHGGTTSANGGVPGGTGGARKRRTGQVLRRSPNLYSDPTVALDIYGYDVHAHAARAIREWYLTGKLEGLGDGPQSVEADDRSGVERWRADRIMNWFLPDRGDWRPLRPGMGEVRTGNVRAEL